MRLRDASAHSHEHKTSEFRDSDQLCSVCLTQKVRFRCSTFCGLASVCAALPGPFHTFPYTILQANRSRFDIMPAAKTKAGNSSVKPRRKRQRKTRTLAVSSDDDSDSSSSSSSSSDDSESEEQAQKPVKSEAKRRTSVSSSSSLSSSSSSSSSSSASSASSSSSSSSNRSSSSESSSESSSSSDSEDSDSDPSINQKRSKRRRITADPESQGNAGSSSGGTRKHIFRLTPEPADQDRLQQPSATQRASFQRRSLQALEPEMPRLPHHLQRIVDAKTSSPSARNATHSNNNNHLSNSKSTPKQSEAQRERRQQAFRSLWLKAVADEFGDELDSIRTVSLATWIRSLNRCSRTDFSLLLHSANQLLAQTVAQGFRSSSMPLHRAQSSSTLALLISKLRMLPTRLGKATSTNWHWPPIYVRAYPPSRTT